MLSWRLPVGFLVAAWGCLIVAYLNRDVYPPAFGRNPQFDPDAGWTAYAPLEKADIPPSRFSYPDITKT